MARGDRQECMFGRGSAAGPWVSTVVVAEHIGGCALWHGGGLEMLRAPLQPCAKGRPHRLHVWAGPAVPDQQCPVTGGVLASWDRVWQCWGRPAQIAEFGHAGEITTLRCLGDGREACTRLLVYDFGPDGDVVDTHMLGWTISERAGADGAVAERVWRCEAHSTPAVAVRPVLRLPEVAVGAGVDRPIYILDDVALWSTFVAPAGTHTGHTVLLTRVRKTNGGRLGVVRCLRCRCKWSFVEYDDPATDPYRFRA